MFAGPPNGLSHYWPMQDLPEIALSIRQPWAWAVVAGFKRIENRSAGSIRSGGMICRRIAVHAAAGLKQAEYDWGAWRLGEHGVACPRPEALVRGAIIGAVDVVDIVSESDSEWFGGQMGLVLENAQMCDPVPSGGALGYFRWSPAGAVAPSLTWMTGWHRPNGDANTADLFGETAAAWQSPPPKPFR